MRVTDAQCLAAFAEAEKDHISILTSPDASMLYVVDISQKHGEQIIWSGKDIDMAQTMFKIAYMRSIVTAALNVC